MSPFNSGAVAQAERDAGAKVVLSTERRSLFRWLLAQRLKTQFLIVIAALFVAYASISAMLSATGLRTPPQTKIAAKKKPAPTCADAWMSVTERAKCIADRDPPVVIQRPGTDARIKPVKAAHARPSADEQLEMKNELARLRDAKRYQALRDEFERRMAEMISDDLKLPPDLAGRTAYYEDAVVVMAEMLQLSDHPMKHSRGQKLSADFYPDRNAAAAPAGGDEAERRLRATCADVRANRGRYRACAITLRELVFQLRYAASTSALHDLAFSARPSG